MNMARWSEYLGEHPPPALKRFFTEDNYVARAILMDPELRERATMIHTSERAALTAININARKAEAQDPKPPNEESLTVEERAESGEEWSLTRNELAVKELQPCSQIVTIDYINPTPVSKSQEFMQKVKNILNQERAPEKGPEEVIIRLINFTNGHEFRIGQILNPPAPRDLHDDFNKLPMDSIVRSMTAELCLHNGDDMFYNNGTYILNLFYNNKLNPKVLQPNGAMGTLAVPTLSQYILNAARSLKKTAATPSEILLNHFTDEQQRGVLNTFIIAYHVWAMQAHRDRQYYPMTGISDPD